MAHSAIFAALVLAALWLSGSATACGLAAERPNVLLVMTYTFDAPTRGVGASKV